MIDLHTHSLCSDGTDTPTELVVKAARQGIKVLALTDHDTSAGWQEAQDALKPGLDLVLGAEISALTSDGISVHIVGLLFDGEHSQMQQMLSLSRDQRVPRLRKMIELMKSDGIDIAFEDLVVPVGATVGRPHLADALVRKGIVSHRDQAFAHYLHNDSRYYVAHQAPTPEEAIAMISDAGGVSIIAHAYASHRGKTIEARDFESLVSAGLHAIEVDHRDHSTQERFDLARVALEFNLVMTGSSDYHGTGKLNQLAENVTAPEQWERLESLANARRVVRK